MTVLDNYVQIEKPAIFDVCLFQNKLIEEELVYDTNELTHTNLYTEQKMTHEQMLVFDEILNAVNTDSGGFYFIYGHVKLRLYSHLVAERLIIGLIPITISDESTCNNKHGSLKSELLIQSSLIIWDEAPMLNKMGFEALDWTFRDLVSVIDQRKTHQPFGGKVVVQGGDFIQILPVIPKGNRHDIFSSAINSSHLWSFCKVLKLHTNMRLLMSLQNKMKVK
ncbi:uncharacterized protein [Arachis hypogaea]|uniref:uncharacterized protein n=1 Tax=Arachis hypogaea TaxID=3818 RepID=UPI003B21A1C4